MQESIADVLLALKFAAERHRGQKRKGKDGAPYVNHLIAVAETLARHGVRDTATLQAAVLHDTIEDVNVTADELRARFGPEVASLVLEVTDDRTLPKAERKRLQVEYAPHKSKAAKLIKLADKISNVRDIAISPPTDWDVQRRAEYFTWAESVVNGLRGVHPVLEAEFDATLQDARMRLEDESD